MTRTGCLRRHGFLVGLALAAGLGLAFPRGGEVLREHGFVLPALVAAVLFLSGFRVVTSRLLRAAFHFRAIGLALGTTYAVAPAAAFALAAIGEPSAAGPGAGETLFLEAVMLAAAQAGTLASALALTALAGGDQALALAITVLSNVLAAVLTPLVLAASLGAVVSLPLAEMMAELALVVVLPVMAGQLARRVAGARARPIESASRLLPQAIILVFIYTGFASASGELLEAPGMAARFFGVTLALHAVLLAWTWTASRVLRLSPPERTAVVLTGSQKTLPNGIYIWKEFFPANPYGAVPLVLYHVIQLVADSALVPLLARRGRPEAATPRDPGRTAR